MIVITLGNGAEFYITQDMHMGIRRVQNGQVTDDVPLGAASEKRLDTVLLHMGSLRIHTFRN